jgi:cyclase
VFRPRVIPTLLLKGKGLVKTIKFKNPKYIGDPINAVRIFNDLEADELIFLDITATKEKRTISPNLIKDIGDEAFMPFSVGGGIRTVDQARNSIAAGAEKVVLNTMAHEKPEIVAEVAEAIGNQSVVVSVDVSKDLFGKYRVYTSSGKKRAKTTLEEHITRVVSLGAGEIFINSINNDGEMLGYDIDLIKKISDLVGIPVIACGGAGNTKDLYLAFKEGHASAVSAGSMFVFHGPRRAVLINYPDKKELENLFIS